MLLAEGARMTKAELDLIAPSSAPAIDNAIDRMYQQMVAAAEAGDREAMGNGIASILHLIDRLSFVRTEAGRFLYELLPDEDYRYRGEDKTRKAPWQNDDGTMYVEPKLVGGGWRRFDYTAVLKAVADKAFGLDSKIVTSTGEVAGTVEDVVSVVVSCASFSGVKADHQKNTGLVAYGFDRGDFGEYEEPRRDVKVNRSKGTT